MAFIYEINGKQFFNVSSSVGYAGANYWTDIMLVQFLIHKIYEYDTMSANPLFGADALQVYMLPDPRKDFKNPAMTAEWIGQFQRDMTNRIGINHLVDKRVDRAKGNTINPTTQFTMNSLNYQYRRFYGDGFVREALKDYLMPPLLAKELTANQVRTKYG
jgi:hypothetical protein